MKKLLVLSSIALLYASLGLAQDSSAQPSAQSPNSTPTSSSGTSGTIQGCLSGSEGSYTLTQDSTGTVFKLVGSTDKLTDKLKEHVGHEVAITGQMAGDSGSATSPSSGSSDSNTSTGSTLQVSDVKMVSKHCASGSDAPQSR
jgi:hypothetical protein